MMNESTKKVLIVSAASVVVAVVVSVAAVCGRIFKLFADSEKEM